VRLAVIPARGGSKRIQGKNLLNFFGKPLLTRAIETAESSGLFDVIHVSTDDPNVRAAATAAGHEPEFERPPDLSGDTTPILPVLESVVKRYAQLRRPVDEIALLFACAPLLRPDDLRAGFDLFTSGGRAAPVLAVGALPVPLERVFEMKESGLVGPIDSAAFFNRSQDLPDRYQDAGAFAFFTLDQLHAHAAGSGKGFLPYVLPRQRCVDIDTPEDVEMARTLYKGLR
jgi:pseudaminic acid cytidylyltransferase